jgi:hypothetical protein
MDRLKKSSSRCSILLVILAIVFLYVAPASVEVAADEGLWIENPATSGYYRLTGSMNWMDAEAQAVAWGGHLVTLNSWEEESWIQETFGENEHFWIGFNDIEEEDNWVWSSGEPVDYTNGAENEPNNYNNEDAAVMNWCWEGAHVQDPCLGNYWNDLPTDGHLKGVVEKSFQIFLPIVLKNYPPTPILTTVSASAYPFQSTGISVTAGNRLEFSASGTWYCGLGWTGPDGDPDIKEPNSPAPSASLCALVGMIDDVQTPTVNCGFFVGSTNQITATQSGILYLSSNDHLGPCDGINPGSCYNDNQGVVSVWITVWEH